MQGGLGAAAPGPLPSPEAAQMNQKKQAAMPGRHRGLWRAATWAACAAGGEGAC